MAAVRVDTETPALKVTMYEIGESVAGAAHGSMLGDAEGAGLSDGGALGAALSEGEGSGVAVGSGVAQSEEAGLSVGAGASVADGLGSAVGAGGSEGAVRLSEGVDAEESGGEEGAVDGPGFDAPGSGSAPWTTPMGAKSAAISRNACSSAIPRN
jgi:hypothetical protein